MGLQRIQTAFRGISNPTTPFGTLNLFDQWTYPGVAYASAWSPGTTMTDVAPGQQVGRNWKLLSVGVQGYLFMSSFANVPLYGKLGRVVAAVDLSGAAEPGRALGGLTNLPLLPLPPDPTMQADMWTPENNPLPPTETPSNTIPGGGLPLGVNISLPVPLPTFDVPVGVGIWIFPALMGVPTNRTGFQTLLQMINASYILNFDDGS